MILRATLFQTLSVTTGDDHRPLDLGSPTSRSLFAYLLLHRAQPLNRRRLAFLFWSRATESAARRNLRQYIHHLRTTLEPIEIETDTTLLLADGSSIQINPDVPIQIDVDSFKRGARSDATCNELLAAITLYKGDLLEDVYDEWCDEERGTLRRLYLSALDRATLFLQNAERHAEAIPYAQKWASSEPLDESAHRRLLALYAATGDRHRAVQHYQSLVKTLADELNAEPLPETQALFQSIQQGLGIRETKDQRLKIKETQPPIFNRPSSILSPFVGREHELEQLDLALAQTQHGSGQLILIAGEAGIGKTRLIQEYLARHPDLAVMQSNCHELEGLSPYAPLRQALQQGIKWLPPTALQPPPSWLASLASSSLPSLAEKFSADEPVGTSASLRDAIINLLIVISQYSTRPLHLVLDDLHWGDTPTWDLLGALARQAASTPILAIGLYRAEDLPDERARWVRSLQRNNFTTSFTLQPFTPEQSIALAEGLHPDISTDPIFLRRLYQETEGNPFFIIETVRSLTEIGRSAKMLPGGLTPTSISLQRVIEARLDRLSAPSREVLGIAAAIGRAFTLALLEEISQTSAQEIIAFIESWMQRGLVTEESQGYNFRHDKIRQVVYSGLSRARREYIHRRIAEVLETAVPPADAVTLAHHYSRGDQPLRALPYLTQAGELALRLRAYHDARQFGLQAVGLLGYLTGPRQREERIDLNLQLAQAYAFSGDLTRASEILNETERLASGLRDEARLGKIFRHSAQLFWLRGLPETAGDYARRTLRAAEELNDTQLLQASLRMLGRVSIALSAFDDAIAYFLRSVNIQEETISDKALRANASTDLPVMLGYLGVAYARVGAWERALVSAQRGLELAEASQTWETIAFARMQLAFVHVDYHNWQACLGVLQGTSDLFEQESLTPSAFMLLALRGMALAHNDQLTEGIAAIRKALAWADETDYRVFNFLPRLFLAESLLLANDLESAQTEIMRVLKESRAAGNRMTVGYARRVLAEILTRASSPNWVEIENYLIESMHILRQVRARPELARTYLALRKLYDRAGQIAWAVDCHFRATSIFEELGMSEELRLAQGQAAGDRRGAVVIPDLPLRGPNAGVEK
jgi:DNA-binding SARP family transcriptional activator